MRIIRTMINEPPNESVDFNTQSDIPAYAIESAVENKKTIFNHPFVVDQFFCI